MTWLNVCFAAFVPCTARRCVPSARLTFVSSCDCDPPKTLTPSTHNPSDVTKDDEFVPATTCTGEATAAWLAGVQMVTDGSTALCGQGISVARKKFTWLGN